MDSRLVNVEEKIAHLERYVAELDGVVREMNDRMAHYQKQLGEIRRIVEAQGGKGGDDGISDQDLEDERPPHW